jgi:tRNA threonylcarbamoyladenosine modification (KEOPS) complex Cgi121 subunit
VLQYLVEQGRYVEITGYRNIRFEAAEAFLKANRKQTQTVDIQFFNADLIATQEHLYFAVLNALQAFKDKTNHSKSPAMETMLYASAQGQIQKAIDRSGINPQTKNMAVTLIGEDPAQIQNTLQTLTKCVGSGPDESVLEMTKAKEAKIKKAFGIQTAEIETLQTSEPKDAIVNLVIEQMALLATQL